MKKVFALLLIALVALGLGDEFDLTTEEDFEEDDEEVETYDAEAYESYEFEGGESVDGDEDHILRAGQEFQASYAKRTDVTVTPSGMMFRPIVRNKDPSAKLPTEDSFAKVFLLGKVAGGSEFSSVEEDAEPSIVAVSQIIAGWKEAMLMMKEGDEWEVVVPPSLAYGAVGVGETVPPHATLILNVKLIEVDPDVSLFRRASMFLSKDIEGLPMDIKYWHLFALVTYFSLRKGASALANYILGKYNKSCTARHILVGHEKLANDLKGKILGGADFAKVAREYSTCPSKKKGGLLGKFSPGQMVKEFDAVCFDEKTKIGKLYGPIKTQFGWHLIIVDAMEGIVDVDPKKKKKKN